MRICGTGRQIGIWPKASIRSSLNLFVFVIKLYSTFFAYSYLEGMIRTTTSDYELPLFDRDKQPVKVSVGMALIALAIKENQNNPDYVALLEQAKRHFKYTQISIDENGRNSVMHGRIHPRFWTKESFEQLIHDIAVLSKYSRF